MHDRARIWLQTWLASSKAAHPQQATGSSRQRLANDESTAYARPVAGRGRRFGKVNDRHQHLQTDNIRLWPCSFPGCTKQFRTAAYQRRHLPVHATDKPWICLVEGCTRRFLSVARRQEHLRVHSDDRPWRCQLEGCPRRFKWQSDARVHMRAHSGSKPWVCPVEGCPKRFIRNSLLQSHLVTHSDEKPWRCPVEGCDKRFAHLSHRRSHLLAHSEARPWPCPLGCGHASKRQRDARVHLRTRHPGRSAPARHDVHEAAVRAPGHCPDLQHQDTQPPTPATGLAPAATGPWPPPLSWSPEPAHSPDKALTPDAALPFLPLPNASPPASCEQEPDRVASFAPSFVQRRGDSLTDSLTTDATSAPPPGAHSPAPDDDSLWRSLLFWPAPDEEAAP